MEDLTKAKQAVATLAQHAGIPEKEIVYEIELAVSEAIITAYRENDQEVLERWEQIPRSGTIPTAYEIITYLGNKLIISI